MFGLTSSWAADPVSKVFGGRVVRQMLYTRMSRLTDCTPIENLPHQPFPRLPSSSADLHLELVGFDDMPAVRGPWHGHQGQVNTTQRNPVPAKMVQISTVLMYSTGVSQLNIRGGIVTSFQLWVGFGILAGLSSNHFNVR